MDSTCWSSVVGNKIKSLSLIVPATLWHLELKNSKHLSWFQQISSTNECLHLISCHVSGVGFANSIEIVGSIFVASMW